MYKGKNTLHIYLVWYYIIGTLILSISMYLDGNYPLGYIFIGFFAISVVLYWFYGRSYFGVDLFDQKAEDKNNMTKKSKARRTLHFLVILDFLIGPVIWAAICFWVGRYFWGYVSIGTLILCSTLYWFYGIKYFNVD